MTSNCVGQTLILDGKAWTIQSVTGKKGFATRADDRGRMARVFFNATELMDMGAGLVALPGRIEAPGPRGANELGVGVVTGSADE